MHRSDMTSFTATQERHGRAVADEMAPFEEADRAVIEARRACTSDVERRIAEIVASDTRYAVGSILARTFP